MHAQQIASRLLSKHGPVKSIRKVTYRLTWYKRILHETSGPDAPPIAHTYARLMLWKSVSHHLINS